MTHPFDSHTRPGSMLAAMGAKDRRRLIALLLVEIVVLLAVGTLAARNLWDAQALLGEAATKVHSFHVEVRDFEDGPLSADVALRPDAYRVMGPDGRARQIEVGDVTYQRADESDHWLRNATWLDMRALALDVWNVGGYMRLVGRDDLPGGPAWHLHDDLDGDGPNGIPDIWIGVDGSPRRAIERLGSEPAHLVHVNYSNVNQVPPIDPPPPEMVIQPDQTLIGWCDRQPGPPPCADADARVGSCGQVWACRAYPRMPPAPALSIGGLLLSVTELHPSPSAWDCLTMAIDLRLENRMPRGLAYTLTLETAGGQVHLLPASGVEPAGSLAPDQVAVGRLTYEIPVTPEQPNCLYPSLLSIHTGDRAAYLVLTYEQYSRG